jgi:anti-anti-sigma regulatory factor
MEIKVLEDNGATIVNICGRLDTVTSPDLEKVVNPLIELGKSIIFNCEVFCFINWI